MDRQELIDLLDEKSVELLATASESWQGDSPNDILARGMIGAMRPLMMALTSACRMEEPVSPIILGVAVRQYDAMLRCVKALEELAKLR